MRLAGESGGRAGGLELASVVAVLCREKGEVEAAGLRRDVFSSRFQWGLLDPLLRGEKRESQVITSACLRAAGSWPWKGRFSCRHPMEGAQLSAISRGKSPWITLTPRRERSEIRQQLRVDSGCPDSWTGKTDGRWAYGSDGENIDQNRPQRHQPSVNVFKDWLDSLQDMDGTHTFQMTEADKTFWYENAESYRFKYEIKDNLLIAYLPLPIHDCIVWAFTESWTMENDHLPNVYKRRYDLSPYQCSSADEVQAKVPDVSMTLKSAQYPCLVFEVGVSQARPALLDNVRHWFRMTGGVCKVVVTVLIDDGVKNQEKAEKAESATLLEEEEEEVIGIPVSTEIRGDNYGPYHSGKNILMGIVHASLEVWRYTPDFEDKLKRVREGKPGDGSDDFVILLPPSPSLRKALRFEFKGLVDPVNYPSVTSDNQYFEFSLDLYRQQIMQAVQRSAKLRSDRLHKNASKDEDYDPFNDSKGKPKRQGRHI